MLLFSFWMSKNRNYVFVFDSYSAKNIEVLNGYEVSIKYYKLVRQPV